MLNADFKHVKSFIQLLLNKHARARSVHCMFFCYWCEKSEVVVWNVSLASSLFVNHVSKNSQMNNVNNA